jgi:5,10-methylenetetrahydromethanopterin reductase
VRFSASLANDHTPAEIVEAATYLDGDRTYENLFVGDERLQRNTYALLSLAAANTDRIGLGTGVTNPYTRHPAMTAAAIATTDELSDGRAKLGLGAGSPIVLDPLSYDQSDPLGTLRDAVKVIRPLLRGERATLDRDEFGIDDAAIDCATDRDVPIYVAGRGPSILGLGGYRGDGVFAGAGCASVDGMDYAREKIRRGAEKAGRDLDDVDVVCWAFCSVADDREAALDGVTPLVAKIVEKAPLKALEAIGLDPDAARRVKELDDVSTLPTTTLTEHVPRPVVEQFAVAGTPADCRAHLQRLADSGVDHVGLLAFDNDERPALGSLKAVSESVVPDLDSDRDA